MRTFVDYVLWSDGACDPNPGPGGWGVVIERAGEVTQRLSGSAHSTTNNEMELRAILEGLRAVPKFVKVRVCSDSIYAIKCVSVWWVAWARAGWKTRDGREPANMKIIQDVLVELQTRKAEFQHVRAHSGIALNEEADQLAVSARRALTAEASRSE